MRSILATKQAHKGNIEQELKPIQALLKKFTNDWSFNLSAALAYNLLLATFPIIVALLSLLGFAFGLFGQNATTTIADTLNKATPTNINAQDIVLHVQRQLQQSSGVLGLIALVSAILVGSRLFALIETFFSIIYHARPRPFVRRNLIALGMFVCFIFLVPLISFAASLPTLVFTLFKSTPVGNVPFLSSAMGILGGLLAGFILFMAIYTVVPNLHIRLSHGWRGALGAAIALQLYLLLFPVYATHFLKGAIGAVGFSALLLVFFYYFAVILFLGAEINAFFAEGVRPIPNDLATFVSTMAGRLNEDIPQDEAQVRVDTKPTEYADKEHTVESIQTAQEADVPPRVAQNPKIQDEVIRHRNNEDHKT